MPESCEHPHDDKIPYRCQVPFPASPERDIDIVPEPRAKGSVPSPVEFRDAARPVRVHKVDDKMESEHHAYPGRHQRIAPEVHIQSQGEVYGPHPGKRRRYALKADLLNLIPEKAQGIRKKDLHSKSEHKKEQAVVESLYGYSSLPLLKSHVVPAHDRALGHLGEHGKIDHRIYDIRAPCDLPPEKIGLVRDHLKEIETEAEREYYLV